MEELQAQINSLKNEVSTLRLLLNKGSFSSVEVFDKEVVFNSKIKPKNKSANLAACQTGELSVVGGKLYICSATDTWTVCGTQT